MYIYIYIYIYANWLIDGEESITLNWQNFKIPHNEKTRHIRLVSEVIQSKKIKLLGHIMRCDHEDPLYQSTFKDEGTFNIYEKQRVGRPRGHWAEDTMNKAQQMLAGTNFDRDDPDHYVYLISQALMRNI